MSAREERQKRKQWKNNSKRYRIKKGYNLQRILVETPPQSPTLSLRQSFES